MKLDWGHVLEKQSLVCDGWPAATLAQEHAERFAAGPTAQSAYLSDRA